MDIYRRSYDSIANPATSWRFPSSGVARFAGPTTAKKTSLSSMQRKIDKGMDIHRRTPRQTNLTTSKQGSIKMETDEMPSLVEDINSNFECTCKRKDLTVLCTLCGYVSTGRIMQRKCLAHPKVQYLMDYTHCPHCRCSCLVEFDPKKEEETITKQ